MPLLTDDERGSRVRPGWVAALVAVALYAPTLWGTFIYDDLFQAMRDPRLADVRRWGEYWTEAYFPTGPDRLWRPLVSMSYAVQHRLHGPVAWPLHLVNILLHAGASAAVGAMVVRLARVRGAGERVARYAGLAAGVLFAAHPVHVEGVAYIVGRADSACTLATIGAVILALGPGRRSADAPVWTGRRAAGIFACCWVAVGCKEQGLMAPLLVAGAWWVRRASTSGSIATPASGGESGSAAAGADVPVASVHAGTLAYRNARGLAPVVDRERRVARGLAAVMLLTVSAYVLFRERQFRWTFDPESLDEMIQPLAVAHGASRWLIPVAVLGRAAQLMVAPVRLSPEYGYAVITPVQRWDDPYLWAGFAVVLTAVVGLAWAVRRRAWGAVFLLGAAGLTYGPVSNVTLIGTSFGERLVYMPSAFLLGLAGWGWARWAAGRAREGAPRRVSPSRAACAVGVVVVGLLAWRTVTYAVRWNDRLAFYEQSLAENPRAVRLAVLVATERIERGDWAGARRAIEQGLAIAPDYWKLWTQMMWVSAEEGKFDEARWWQKGAWARKAYPPDVMWIEGLLERREAEAKGRGAR